MLNPTFASFKTSKPSINPVPNLYQTNINIQPKSFYDLKFTNNNNNNNQIQFHHHHHHHHHKPQKINFSNTNQCKKTSINYNLKKSQNQLNITQPQNNLHYSDIKSLKQKINSTSYVPTKKSMIKIQQQNKNIQIIRPIIIAPTLLKNKSFINSLTKDSKNNSHCSSKHQDDHQSYQFQDVGCSDSFQRKSQQYSMNASGSQNGDNNSYSCCNQSKFDDLKNSCNSSQMDDKTINFSRKSGRTMYKGPHHILKNNIQSNIYFTNISQLTKQLKQSHQQQNIKNSNQLHSQNIDSSLCKKYHNYKKNKQCYQNRKITLDQFQLLQQIGQGKYGKVYMIRHKYTNFICALKIISKQKIKLQNIQNAFIRQIKIQMYLIHPNIVKLYGFFHDKQNIYLIMECCFFGHLLKIIKQRKIFQQAQILDIISNVFQAISFLHCHGIIHRDLKPQNIVIQYDVYKICDFGWAAYTKGDSRTTFCGTPLYVCPQVLKGNQYDQKADVWGLGVLTYELAYGRVPFPIWNQSDMIKIVKDPVYFPTWTSVSDKMQQLIKSMLNKDPTKRLSINQIMASSLISDYVGQTCGFKSEIDTLF